MRVLMVEDEKYMAEAIVAVLKKNNYTVDLVLDGESGLDCALSDIYDIIILDIMLPKMDGLCILKEIRQNGIKTPVLLLTARDRVEDKVNGLDYGADDYLAKPFHTDELLARLRALGRRKSELHNQGILIFSDIKLNPHSLLIECNNRKVKLTLKETQLLELLIEHKNMIISKDTIIEKLWGYNTEAEDSHVEIHMSLLRKKISQLQCTTTIRTIRGSGYILER